VAGHALPEAGVVAVDDGAGAAFHRSRRPVCGGVLEDAEAVGAGEFAARADVRAGRDEVARPEFRGLAAGHRLDHGVEGDLVARAQGAQVLLVAVGGDDRVVARLVEQGEEFVVGGGAFRTAGEAGHGPCLEHGGRGDGVRSRVRGTGVTHGLAPVPDHRLVDGVAADPGGGGRPALVGLQARLELLVDLRLTTHSF
jgi:hypothetical protein